MGGSHSIAFNEAKINNFTRTYAEFFERDIVHPVPSTLLRRRQSIDGLEFRFVLMHREKGDFVMNYALPGVSPSSQQWRLNYEALHLQSLASNELLVDDLFIFNLPALLAEVSSQFGFR